MLALAHNSSKTLSETLFCGSKFILSVPFKRVGSCGMMVTIERRVDKSMFAISIPLISIFPLSSSTILVKAFAKVDFPAPVRPTMPTLSPDST